MDPVLADLLSDIAVMAAGVATGVLVARITAARSRDLERERRRLDLIGVFLRDIETLRDQGKLQAFGRQMKNWSEAQDRAHSALSQLEIIAPKLKTPALKLWQSVQMILTAAQLRAYAGDREIPPEARDPDRLDKEYADAHTAFVEAARRELS